MSWRDWMDRALGKETAPDGIAEIVKENGECPPAGDFTISVEPGVDLRVVTDLPAVALPESEPYADPPVVVALDAAASDDCGAPDEPPADPGDGAVPVVLSPRLEPVSGTAPSDPDGGRGRTHDPVVERVPEPLAAEPEGEPEAAVAEVREVRMRWKGAVSRFLEDDTRLIDLEGAFRSGKTTAAIWKVLNSCVAHPGMHWLICRYSDGDTQSKLKPVWRGVLREAGIEPQWDPAAQCDTLPNGSKVYIFGLKAQDQVSRYGKLRGMTLAGVYVDQGEELPHDIFLELIGRLSQSHYPHQLILTPNPPDEGHWLATEFPEDNRFTDRHYISVSIYDNAHNLPAEAITGLEQAYPPSHPKHRSAVLGKRGLNVIGQPVYGGDPARGLSPVFDRSLHVRPLALNLGLPLSEAIDFGKHHPCVVWGQYTPYNQLILLGGILGQNLYLEDFAPIMQEYRAQWFPGVPYVQTCCDPAGSHDNSQGIRNNGVRVLQDHGFAPRFQPNSNSPDIRLAMIERLAAYMRKRTPQGEAFGINSDPSKWLRISADDVKPWPFISDAFEAGYVWDDHLISVGNKQVRKPKKDGWYEHGMNCCEYLELNFGGAQPTVQQVERQMARITSQNIRLAQRDADPYRWNRTATGGRGGY